MKNTRILLTLLLMTVSSALVAADSMQAIADRTLIRELMDRYGIVHDSGTPEEYADLFTADGEIAVASGGPAIVKGREALIAQARRDHERFGNEPAANGKTTSIMRHLISNAQIKITGAGTATGSCYVTTVVKKGDVGPSILSISRYTDRYVKQRGEWRIQRREIAIEFGNGALGKQLGFGGAASQSAPPPVYPNAPAGFDARQSGVPSGRVERVEYDSKVTGNKRPAIVYTPPGYSAARKYPVLYLLHGIGGNERHWTQFGAADVILDNLIAANQAVPMIIVMPNGRASNEPAMVFGPRGGRAGAAPGSNDGGRGRPGGAGMAVEFTAYAAFQRELVGDLIPFVESRYSVQADREHRALAGLSMGGGQSLNFGLANLDTFAWVGGFSSAPNTAQPAQLVPNPTAAAQKLKLLWVSCGDQDSLFNISEGVHNYLSANKVPHIWHIDVGGAHTFPVWKNDLYHFSTLLFR